MWSDSAVVSTGMLIARRSLRWCDDVGIETAELAQADVIELTAVGPGGFGSVGRAAAHPTHFSLAVGAFAGDDHLALAHDVDGVGRMPVDRRLLIGADAYVEE